MQDLVIWQAIKIGHESFHGRCLHVSLSKMQQMGFLMQALACIYLCTRKTRD